MADPAAVESGAETVEEEPGSIDVWANNPMTSVFAELMGVGDDEFRRPAPGGWEAHGRFDAPGLARRRPPRGARETLLSSASVGTLGPARLTVLGP